MTSESSPFSSSFHRAPTERDFRDARLLCALAAAHLFFGQLETAASFVALAEWFLPNDQRVIELSALINLRWGRLDEALAATTRLRASGFDLSDELKAIEARVAVRCT